MSVSDHAFLGGFLCSVKHAAPGDKCTRSEALGTCRRKSTVDVRNFDNLLPPSHNINHHMAIKLVTQPAQHYMASWQCNGFKAPSAYAARYRFRIWSRLHALLRLLRPAVNSHTTCLTAHTQAIRGYRRAHRRDTRRHDAHQSAVCSRDELQQDRSAAEPCRPSRVLTQHGCVGCLRAATMQANLSAAF